MELSPYEKRYRTAWRIAILLELIGSLGIAIAVTITAPWHAELWAPSGWLVYLAFAYRRWMHL